MMKSGSDEGKLSLIRTKYCQLDLSGKWFLMALVRGISMEHWNGNQISVISVNGFKESRDS